MPSELLSQAITLAKSGEKEKAALLLRHIVQAEPQNETAWLWLADVQNDPAGRLRILRTFQAANPSSRVAQMAVERLSAQMPAPSQAPAPNPHPVSATRTSSAAPARPVKRSAPAAPPKKQAALTSKDIKTILSVFGGIIVLGLIVFLVVWITLPKQAALPALVQIQPTSQLPVQPTLTRTPHFLPSQAPTPTRSECDCGEALAYLERTGKRITDLQSDMLLADDSVDNLPYSKADFSTLGGWGRARYNEQFDETPPPCLISFQQNMNTFFASWYHAMDGVAEGNYNNAAAFLNNFFSKEAEIYAEAQSLIEKFQKCAPPGAGGEEQTG